MCVSTFMQCGAFLVTQMESFVQGMVHKWKISYVQDSIKDRFYDGIPLEFTVDDVRSGRVDPLTYDTHFSIIRIVLSTRNGSAQNRCSSLLEGHKGASKPLLQPSS